jgi:hypothetical protein
VAVLLDLVDEGLFDLGQALTHPHGTAKATTGPAG